MRPLKGPSDDPTETSSLSSFFFSFRAQLIPLTSSSGEKSLAIKREILRYYSSYSIRIRV